MPEQTDPDPITRAGIDPATLTTPEAIRAARIALGDLDAMSLPALDALNEINEAVEFGRDLQIGAITISPDACAELLTAFGRTPAQK